LYVYSICVMCYFGSVSDHLGPSALMNLIRFDLMQFSSFAIFKSARFWLAFLRCSLPFIYHFFTVLAIFLFHFGIPLFDIACCLATESACTPAVVLCAIYTVDCVSRNCSGHGACVRGQCLCYAGYHGSDCSLQTTTPDANFSVLCVRDCSRHGVFDVRSQTCVCQSGWTGYSCENGSSFPAVFACIKSSHT